MKNMKKLIISCLTLVLLICNAYGSLNAMSYTYDFWKNIIPSTEGLAYRETYYSNSINDVNGNKANITFNNLIDFSVYDGKIFVLDSRKTFDTVMRFPDSPEAGTSVAGVSSILILNQSFR